VPRRTALEMAKKLGCEAIIPISRDENVVRKTLLDMQRGDADGILLWGAHNHDLLKTLAAHGMPVVVGGTTSADFSYVSIDQRKISALAVNHLVSLGHAQIGYIRQDNIASYGLVVGHAVDGYRATCQQLGLHESAARVVSIYSDTPGDIEEAWRQLDVVKSGITALICPHPRVAQTIIELARVGGLGVPADLSVMILLDHTAAIRNVPPITAVHQDSATMTRIAFQLLHTMAIKPLPAAKRRELRVMFEPSLVFRASTARLGGLDATEQPVINHDAPPVRSWPHIGLWLPDAAARKEQVAELNRKPFRDGLGSMKDYHPVDLAAYVNRTCSHEHSWLGDQPLLHLPVGRTPFHGVPFDILDETRNDGRCAIVLRSKHAHSSGGSLLPLAVTLPIERKVAAIYLLHGAGWTYQHQAFAEYVFTYADGAVERVAVIPFADEPDAPHQYPQWREESIIHDWHPNRGRFESSRTLPCVITERGDPLNYERTLYTWQWMNPHPGREVRSLTLRMLEPLGRATLGVLAVTMQAVQ
jgi:DNA-binding LacI/PurR family transcriptional regulator